VSVGELLRERASARPHHLFLWCGDERRTFAELDARSDALAAGLAQLGVARGDRVAFLSASRIEVLDLFFACAKLGAIHVPLNAFLKGDFLAYQLADSGACALVADQAGIAAVAPVRDRCPELRHVVALDEADASLAAAGPPPKPEVAPSDVLSILYTSGTTGMPKGCMLAHGWYTAAAASSKAMLDYREGDVICTALPLFHGWALGIVGACLVHGMTGVIEPSFSPASMLDRLAATGATVFAGVGMMGLALLGLPESEADRRHALRVAFMIPFSPDQQRAFEDRFRVPVFSQMYGQTEAGSISFSRLQGPQNPSSVGLPSPSFEVRLVDDDDREVPTGGVGEIAIRPTVPLALFRGYWRKPEDTIAAWRNLWHHTGDFGRLDTEGFLYFVDRKKDAIRRRGENVSSVQVEAAIVAHPKIAEAAVHAVPSAMTEDEIKACLVLVPDAQVTPAELFGFFAERLPYFAVPRYVEVVEALPKTATMRVQKHLLRERGITAQTWDLEEMGLTVARAQRR
jgi:carnitine-CoA ligase